jgi:hypothetical protein
MAIQCRVPFLLRRESLSAASASIYSLITWRDSAASDNLAHVAITCVYAVPEFQGHVELTTKFANNGIQFRQAAFDDTARILPHARELLYQAELGQRPRGLMLLLSPGATIDSKGVSQSVAEITSAEVKSNRKIVHIVQPKTRGVLPIAALFSFDTLITRGPFQLAGDAWAIIPRKKIFSGTNYLKVKPKDNIEYNVPWLIGCLAARVQEFDDMRLKFVDWAH